MTHLRDTDEALRFLRDLCTVTELREFAAALARGPAARRGRELPRHQRAHGGIERHDQPRQPVAEVRARRLSAHDRPRAARRREATVTGTNGDRLRVALPNKGRLAEPAVVAAARRRASTSSSASGRLSAVARNLAIELLFVRTDDITEYVARRAGRPRDHRRRTSSPSAARECPAARARFRCLLARAGGAGARRDQRRRGPWRLPHRHHLPAAHARLPRRARASRRSLSR